MEICRMKCRQIHLGPLLNLFVGTVWLPGDRSSLSLKHPTRGNLEDLAHSTFSRFMPVNMLRSNKRKAIREWSERILSSLVQRLCGWDAVPSTSWSMCVQVHALKFALAQGSKITLGIGCLCRLRPLTRVLVAVVPLHLAPNSSSNWLKRRK